MLFWMRVVGDERRYSKRGLGSASNYSWSGYSETFVSDSNRKRD